MDRRRDPIGRWVRSRIDVAWCGPTAPEALEANARLEGVADRIRIDTGDARQLPYPNASFDVVLSHWVIHNLPEEADRRKALDEMLRVLRPRGVLVLADIANSREYRTYLTSKGVTDMRTVSGWRGGRHYRRFERWELSPAGTACATSLSGRRKFALRIHASPIVYILPPMVYSVPCSK
jgi:SAM-dependent methyltransferase